MLQDEYKKLPSGWNIPHLEMNEDRHKSAHPGYVIKKCIKCKNEFITAKSNLDLTCGRHGCI